MSNKFSVRKLYDTIKWIPDDYTLNFKDYDSENKEIKIYHYNYFSFYHLKNNYEFGGSEYVINGHRELLKSEKEGVETVPNEFTGELQTVPTLESEYNAYENTYYNEEYHTAEDYTYDEFMERFYRYPFTVKYLKQVLLSHYKDPNSHTVKLNNNITPAAIHSVEFNHPKKQLIFVNINDKALLKYIKEEKSKNNEQND